MPTYDYLCQGCDHSFEKFQSMTARVLRKCPACKKMKLQRLIGAGAGLTIIDASLVNDRVFEIIGGVTVTFDGVTITGGNTTADGGGILNDGGMLTVTASAIIGNTAVASPTTVPDDVPLCRHAVISTSPSSPAQFAVMKIVAFTRTPLE